MISRNKEYYNNRKREALKRLIRKGEELEGVLNQYEYAAVKQEIKILKAKLRGL